MECKLLWRFMNLWLWLRFSWLSSKLKKKKLGWGIVLRIRITNYNHTTSQPPNGIFFYLCDTTKGGLKKTKNEKRDWKKKGVYAYDLPPTPLALALTVCGVTEVQSHHRSMYIYIYIFIFSSELERRERESVCVCVCIVLYCVSSWLSISINYLIWFDTVRYDGGG